MDHELIGHIYNFYAGLKHDEAEARKTQVRMAAFRGKGNLAWRMAAVIEPTARKLQQCLQ
jgi:hypothetical protein